MDDISIRREQCQVQPLNAVPQLQASELINCNFEKTMCKWANVKNASNFDWKLNNGTLPYGPSTGAASTSGYLVAKPANNSARGDKARLISPQIPRPSSEGYCLSFFYHLWGTFARFKFWLHVNYRVKLKN